MGGRGWAEEEGGWKGGGAHVKRKRMMEGWGRSGGGFEVVVGPG